MAAAAASAVADCSARRASAGVTDETGGGAGGWAGAGGLEGCWDADGLGGPADGGGGLELGAGDAAAGAEEGAGAGAGETLCDVLDASEVLLAKCWDLNRERSCTSLAMAEVTASADTRCCRATMRSTFSGRSSIRPERLISSCDVTTRSMDRHVLRANTSSASAGKTLNGWMSLANSAWIFMSVPGLLEEPLPKNFNVCFSSVVVEVIDTSHTTLPGWNSCEA